MCSFWPPVLVVLHYLIKLSGNAFKDKYGFTVLWKLSKKAPCQCVSFLSMWSNTKYYIWMKESFLLYMFSICQCCLQITGLTTLSLRNRNYYTYMNKLHPVFEKSGNLEQYSSTLLKGVLASNLRFCTKNNPVFHIFLNHPKKMFFTKNQRFWLSKTMIYHVFSEIFVLSMFHIKYENQAGKADCNETYEIVLHMPHFNAGGGRDGKRWQQRQSPLC